MLGSIWTLLASLILRKHGVKPQLAAVLNKAGRLWGSTWVLCEAPGEGANPRHSQAPCGLACTPQRVCKGGDTAPAPRHTRPCV